MSWLWGRRVKKRNSHSSLLDSVGLNMEAETTQLNPVERGHQLHPKLWLVLGTAYIAVGECLKAKPCEHELLHAIRHSNGHVTAAASTGGAPLPLTLPLASSIHRPPRALLGSAVALLPGHCTGIRVGQNGHQLVRHDAGSTPAAAAGPRLLWLAQEPGAAAADVGRLQGAGTVLHVPLVRPRCAISLLV